ncbi:hypothetical protein HU200_022425 [Digitaria exilis]|uniref:RNase H type-1 domain-containing protein n=1 Tax=Digitaria exilis TaxID=1010633 RepID=A0A835C7K9_9POAL|nr:hypothetical protein HU200_022425 [Digitaria exilis]
MMMWAWWDARNKANASEGLPEIEGVLRRATLMAIDAKMLKEKTNCKPGKKRVKWTPPEPDILKVNIDGAFLESEKSGAWGYIVRTSDGEAVLAGSGRLTSVYDVLCAEMYACLHALSACSEQGMMKIQIESDCSNLVSAMTKSNFDLSPAGALFQDARLFISLNFVSVEFKYCHRSANECAHELARYGLSRDPDQDCVWSDPLPVFVTNLVTHNQVGYRVNE